FEAADELGDEMFRIGRAAAVPERENLPALTNGAHDGGGGGSDRLRVSRREALMRGGALHDDRANRFSVRRRHNASDDRLACSAVLSNRRRRKARERLRSAQR